MNQKIKNLEYEKLLFIDIETVAGCNNFDENHSQYSIWEWKQRNKETNEVLTAEENIKLYNTKAALFAEWGKIVCISAGFIHNGELHIKSFTGEEKEILINFIHLVKSTGRMLAGHNVISFDIPYIRKRFFINGLTEYLSDKQGCDVYMKPWLLDDAIFDTMVAWKGSAFVNTSLEELAMVFNIPTSKDNCHGNEVTEFYYSGRISEIKTYCEKDVAVVANILRVWKGDLILKPIIREEIVVEEITLLQKLNSNKAIYTAELEEIKVILSKPKISKKDKEIVFDLIKASLSDIDSNFGAIKNIKEIDLIINQLKSELEN